MSPMEAVVVTVVLLLLARKLVVDSAYAIRGPAIPGRRKRSGGGGARRGVRGYLANAWADAWETADQRRTARRQARAQRRTSGVPRWPRLAAARARFGAWWRTAGGHREAHRAGAGRLREEWEPTAFDRAWTRMQQRHRARRARAQARREAGLPRFPKLAAAAGWLGLSRKTGPPAVCNARRRPSPHPRTPAAQGSTPDRASRSAEATAQPTGPAGGNGNQPRPATGALTPALGGQRPGSVAVSFTPQPFRDHNHGKEGHRMPEVTGLVTAMTYASQQQEAHQQNLPHTEQWLAALRSGDVAGEPIAAGTQAMEADQAAAAAWARAHEALAAQLTVKEAYHANPDAGDKRFVTAE